MKNCLHHIFPTYFNIQYRKFEIYNLKFLKTMEHKNKNKSLDAKNMGRNKNIILETENGRTLKCYLKIGGKFEKKGNRRELKMVF